MSFEALKKELLEGYLASVSLENDFGNKGLITVRCPDGFITKKECNNSNITLDDFVICESIEDTVNGEVDRRSHLHALIYQKFPNINTLAQIDSRWPSVWAGMGLNVPPVTNIQASCFGGEISCIDPTKENVEGDYFKKLDYSIISKMRHLNTDSIHAVLIKHIGSLVWGDHIDEVLETQSILDEACFRSYHVFAYNDAVAYIPYALNRFLKRD